MPLNVNNKQLTIPGYNEIEINRNHACTLFI